MQEEQLKNKPSIVHPPESATTLLVRQRVHATMGGHLTFSEGSSLEKLHTPTQKCIYLDKTDKCNPMNKCHHGLTVGGVYPKK